MAMVAATSTFGLARVLEDRVLALAADGGLVPAFAGYHLHDTGRRQP